MSTRVYFIKSKRGTKSINEDCSFNAWHEHDLMDYLLDKLGIFPRDSIGVVRIKISIMKSALTEVDWDSQEAKELVSQDVKWAEENNIKTMRYDFG